MTRPFCQGHGTTWAVRCSVCGKEKYPVAIDKPGPDWVCALCRATSPEKRGTRVAAAAKRSETTRQKGHSNRSVTQGAPEGPEGEDLAS
jgi:hypothetical protein